MSGKRKELFMLPDNEDEWLPRAALDAWEVPAPPSGLEDAIMRRIDITANTDSGVRSSRPVTSLVVPLFAGLVAAALVVVWLATVRGPDEPTTVVPRSSVLVTAPAAESVATLVLKVAPDTAQVTVDGRPIVGPGPFIATALSIGNHRIEVRAEGYLTVTRTMKLGEGTTEIPIRLAAGVVTVSVDVTPSGASLTLLSKQGSEVTRGRVESVFELTRAAGAQYTVVASASGHVSREVNLGLDGSSAHAVSVVLPSESRSTPKPRPPTVEVGTLRIGTNPGVAPAIVSIDGRFLGRTPLANIEVGTGTHAVKWRWDDGTTATQSIRVRAGSVTIAKAGG